jgi:purine nucleosidase
MRGLVEKVRQPPGSSIAGRERNMIQRAFFISVILFTALNTMAFAQTKRKVIIDQDARGPATTDQQSILLLLQSPDVEPLGITVVSGDQWRDEEVAHTLRMLELTHHADVKVYPGAIFPLINSKEEIARWSKLYGKVQYQGAWNEQGTTGKYPSPYHDPFVVPDLPEGNPTLKPEQEDAAHFIIRMLHKYPHEVTIYAGGPLTNLAQVVSLDPNVPDLARELVVMGGSIAPQVEISGRPRIGANLISGGILRQFTLSSGRLGRKSPSRLWTFQ